MTACGFPIETPVNWNERSRATIVSRRARVSPAGARGISVRVSRGRPMSTVTVLTRPSFASVAQASTPAPVSIRRAGRRIVGSVS